jgi:hypothetical protein
VNQNLEPEVVVVVAWCQRHRGRQFGNRVERVAHEPAQWAFTWAFPLGDGEARREGYQDRIAGTFAMTSDYPGCPHCRATAFYLCSNCGTVACWDGESNWVECPSCGRGGPLEGTIQDLPTGGDR